MHLRKITAQLAMSAILVLILASCRDAPAPPDKTGEIVLGTSHALASTEFDTARTVNVFLSAGDAKHDEPLPGLFICQTFRRALARFDHDLAANESGTMVEGMERLVTALDDQAPAELCWWYEPRPDEDHLATYHPAAWQASRLIFAVG